MKSYTIDLETKDPGLTGNEGTSAHDPSRGGYPFLVGIKPMGEPSQVYSWEEGKLRLAALFAEGCHFIGCNIKYDLNWLIHNNVLTMALAKTNRFSDILINAPLIDETKDPAHYKLDGLAKEYGLPQKPIEMLLDAALAQGIKATAKTIGNYFWQLPARLVTEYLIHDLDTTEAVYLKQLPILQELRLTETHNTADMSVVELEEKLIPVLAFMECRGVRVDLDAAEKLVGQIDGHRNHLIEELRQANEGNVVNLNPSKSLTAFLQSRGHTLPKTEKGADSTAEAVLRELVDSDPLVGDILIARKCAKIADDFCTGAILERAVKGRIHPNINQCFSAKEDDGKSGQGVRFGRFSYTKPNLQQVPKRDKVGFDDTGGLGTAMRRLFIAEEGCQFMSADFSAQEPRWIVHWAEKWKCLGAGLVADKYRLDPTISSHDIVAEGLRAEHLSAKEKRSLAKIINLGKGYEMGFNRLVANLMLAGCDAEQAKEILSDYENNFPYVRLASKKAQGVAETNGYVRTHFGRVIRFNLWVPCYGTGTPLPYDAAYARYVMGKVRSPIQQHATYRAFNRVVQGSSADQTKRCMVALFYDENITPTLQVHDELTDAQIESNNQLVVYKNVMENVVRLSVPNLTEIKTGPNWADSEIWKEEG